MVFHESLVRSSYENIDSLVHEGLELQYGRLGIMLLDWIPMPIVDLIAPRAEVGCQDPVSDLHIVDAVEFALCDSSSALP